MAGDGFIIQGAQSGDLAGASYGVSAAGDINGDGIDDLIVGAGNNDSGGSDSGAAYVIYGSTMIGLGGDITGTIVDDDLSGTVVGEKISGLVGNDTLSGGGGDDRLIGSHGADSLLGGAGDDRLMGGKGIDTMTGASGDDLYVVNRKGDLVIEGAGGGNDTVKSETISLDLANYAFVENAGLRGTLALNLTGTSGGNALTGNRGANILNGLGGSDVLDGHNGADTLIGGAGADTFVFSAPLGAGNVDTISDFNVSVDVIDLDHLVFAGLATGALAASAFASNPGGEATDASQRIIYDNASGSLWFDSDGTGAAARVQIAVLTAGLAITNADFFVI